ncbi:DUF6491 family protein [Marinicella meishanensis]|uniref:DUF6491 family protein n=1 Tax=Marinicella meishanensis TaxID=2873263 RepID=UPI001CBD235C|nr:DUF6491 family protein [Marinicella sp. NBU2979]
MKTMLIGLLVLLLAACQENTRKRIDYAAFVEAQELVAQPRVTQFRFQGWQPLDERFLILRSNQRQSYLIELNSFCSELPFAQAITMDQSSSLSLVAKFDAIRVPGQISQRCPIKHIYVLDEVQKQALMNLKNPNEKMLE